MKILLLALLLSTSIFAKEEVYTGIIHDYMIKQAESVCIFHGNLHYIVSIMKLKTDKDKSYPCSITMKVRCQDQTLHEIHDGIGFCFIPRGQLKESL